MSRLTVKFKHNGFEYMATGLGSNNPYAIDKLGKLEDLEEEIGCPLDVRIKVNCDSHIYDENGIKYEVVYVYEDHFDCEDPFDNDMGYTKMCAFDWKDYKKTFWLREDKSE